MSNYPRLDEIGLTQLVNKLTEKIKALVSPYGKEIKKITEFVMPEPTTWLEKTWNNLPNPFYGSQIWTDGDNVYYSYQDNHYILDKSTSTWLEKTWNGIRRFDSIGSIWTDGSNTYYDDSSGNHYILDKSTSTWLPKTWNGLTSFNGNNIWTDGNNVYYSYESTQYILDKSTSTWLPKTWNGLTSFDGYFIWTDGENVYYSYESTQYILDKSTSTWLPKTWNGLTNPNARRIWTDGNNAYYSYQDTHYILDKSTSTWLPKTWNGLTNFISEHVWTDGENIYYSTSSTSSSLEYVLDKANHLGSAAYKNVPESGNASATEVVLGNDSRLTDTKNTAGSTNTSSKIFLIGATSQAANPRTYSDDQVFATNGTLSSNKVSTKAMVALTGSGTAGQDAGADVSPRYIPSKWTFNAGVTVANGEVYLIKIPVAGGTYGVWLSLNNGTNYYPVAISSGASRFTTHYAANTVIAVTYESASTCTCYAKDGADATASVTGIFRVLNDYDANTTYSAMSLAEMTAGTATTSRVVRADRLKAGIESIIDAKTTILTATLAANTTSVSFTNAAISSDELIDVYTSVPNLNYSNMSVSGTTLTLTYPAQSAAVTVKLIIR